jgi:hypothetical protein
MLPFQFVEDLLSIENYYRSPKAVDASKQGRPLGPSGYAQN